MTVKILIAALAVSLCSFAVLSTPAFADETNALNALKEKYEIGKAKLDRSIFSAYTNGVAELRAQSKGKGELEGYLVLQKEQKELLALPIVPSGPARDSLVQKVPGYREMMMKLDADRDMRLRGIQQQYLLRLQSLIKDLMMADQFDEAQRVNEEKDAIVRLMCRSEPAKVEGGDTVEAPPGGAPANGGGQPVEEIAPVAQNPVPESATMIVKPIKELTIIKAIYLGSSGSSDVTALVQDQVEEGKLQVSDYGFLRKNYVGQPKALLIQYKYKGGLLKNIRHKFGETFTISE